MLLNNPEETLTGYSICKLSLSLVAYIVTLLKGLTEIRGPFIDIRPPGSVEIRF